MKIVLLVALFFSVSNIEAQSPKYPVKGTPVDVVRWGSLSVIIMKGFFNETKDSIIESIGKAEFDEMQFKCSSSGWPVTFYKFGMGDEEDTAFEKKLMTLKKYRIAGFQHVYNGIPYERYTIVRVPYDENKDWDPSLQWEGNIYFLLNESDVIVKSEF